jgi:eukaryotic-like serine/threonine-protein kinase
MTVLRSDQGLLRVFKFASMPQRLQALKREATLARILTGSLGQRPDLARALEWNLDATPMIIESSFGGDDLIIWAAREGGLAVVPLERRLTIVAAAACTIAAAHSVGVLHMDIKPGNLLIDDQGQVRLLDEARLASLNVSGIGLTQTGPISSDSRTGTYGYLAPELPRAPLHHGLLIDPEPLRELRGRSFRSL